MQPEDSIKLAAVFFKSVRKVCARDYTEKQIEVWAPADRDMQKWRATFEGKRVFVSELSGDVVGFGELEPNGHIDRFYVDGDHVGHGIGKAIYDAVENEARSTGIEKLFVEASITAKPFFERMGFALVKEQIVTVRSVNMRNFIMEKELVFRG